MWVLGYVQACFSSIHEVRHGVSQQSDRLPHLHFLHRADRWCEALLKHVFFFVLHFTNVLYCDPNTSNMDSSVHDTLFQPPSLQRLCSVFFCPSSYSPCIGQSQIWLFNAVLPRRPVSWSRLLSISVQAGVLLLSQFMKLPVWGSVRCLFVKLETMRFKSSCSHFSFYARYSQFYSITYCCAKTNIIQEYIRI